MTNTVPRVSTNELQHRSELLIDVGAYFSQIKLQTFKTSKIPSSDKQVAVMLLIESRQCQNMKNIRTDALPEIYSHDDFTYVYYWEKKSASHPCRRSLEPTVSSMIIMQTYKHIF